MDQQDIIASARHVAQRVQAGGAPHEDWQPAETVLAKLIAVYADPSRLGGTKRRKDGSERQHPAVVAAARTISRTQDAVVFKVFNLRSVLTSGARGMPHGATRLDSEVVRRYADHLDALLADTMEVAANLPDAASVLDALVPPAIAAAVPGLATDEAVSDTGPIAATEVKAEIMRRRGQGVFRSRVLTNYGYACAFCGLKSRMPEQNSYLLIASHIRPWADSSSHQRLDPENGLSLCAIHDRAFEWGFLTLDEQLCVAASDHAKEHYAPEIRVQAEILALRGTPLVHPSSNFLAPGNAYLAYHRNEVFERRFRKGA